LVLNYVNIETNYDFLRIFDGDSIAQSMLAEISGFSVTTKIYVSTASYMTISFTSDASTVNHGFDASYTINN